MANIRITYSTGETEMFECEAPNQRDSHTLAYRYGVHFNSVIKTEIVRKDGSVLSSYSHAAAALGRLGGSRNTAAQNAARAANAKNAGRPKGSKNKTKEQD